MYGRIPGRKKKKEETSSIARVDPVRGGRNTKQQRQVYIHDPSKKKEGALGEREGARSEPGNPKEIAFSHHQGKKGRVNLGWVAGKKGEEEHSPPGRTPGNKTNGPAIPWNRKRL